MKVLQIDINIYESQVFVLRTRKDLLEMGKVFGIEFADRVGDEGATTYSMGDKQLIWLRSITPGVVAHEATHAAHGILEYIGYEPNLGNDEAEAYLIGYIVEKIHQGYHVPKRKEFEW